MSPIWTTVIFIAGLAIGFLAGYDYWRGVWWREVLRQRVRGEEHYVDPTDARAGGEAQAAENLA